MTITEAITKIDDQKHNTCAFPQKVEWLSALDQMVCKILFPEKDFSGYDDATPGDTLLQIPAPFDEAYLYWLESKIHYQNGEISRFNNANAMFFAAYQRFVSYVLRTAGKNKESNRFH